jgi:hypothetical protein
VAASWVAVGVGFTLRTRTGAGRRAGGRYTVAVTSRVLSSIYVTSEWYNASTPMNHRYTAEDAAVDLYVDDLIERRREDDRYYRQMLRRLPQVIAQRKGRTSFACAGQRHRGRSGTRPSSRRTRGSRRIRTASSSSTDPSGDPEPEGVGQPEENRQHNLLGAARDALASEHEVLRRLPTVAGNRLAPPACGGRAPELVHASPQPEVFSSRPGTAAHRLQAGDYLVVSP